MTYDVREKAEQLGAWIDAMYPELNAGQIAQLLERHLTEARNAAFEEAAQRIDRMYPRESNGSSDHVRAAMRCRDDIRNLKDTTEE